MARKSGSDGAETNRQLRQAALRLFSTYGYAAVSMRQIAKEIGVQAGTLYLYTPDKQSLLANLMQEHLQELLGAWAAWPSAGESTPRALLERFVRFHIQFHVARPDAVFIAYMELRNLEPDNFAVIEALRRKYEDALEQILIDGQNTGAFNVPDTRLAAFALIAMLTGVTTWYREGGRLSAQSIEDIYVEMALGAVGAHIAG